MRQFMVAIQLHPIDHDLMLRLREPEGRVLMEWSQTGILANAFVREDLTGAFLVMNGETADHINEHLATLPMHPYMNTDIIPLEAPLPFA